MDNWNDDQPIYRQLKQQICQRIAKGQLQAGDMLPSVRALGAELKINHLTVMKAYQLLVDEALVVKQRGKGMFVTQNAHQQLLEQERESFLNQQIPMLVSSMKRLNIGVEQLMEYIQKGDSDE
jgi:GntR family transcriptional regulator